MNLKAILYRLAYPWLKFYWILFQPNTKGVNVILENGGKLLMVKNTYGDGSLNFPGGQVESGETPEEAASRELEEELGLTGVKLQKIGSFLYTGHYKKDMTHVYWGKNKTTDFRLDHDEIASAKWYKPEEINESDLSNVAFAVLRLYRKYGHHWPKGLKFGLRKTMVIE